MISEGSRKWRKSCVEPLLNTNTSFSEGDETRSFPWKTVREEGVNCSGMNEAKSEGGVEDMEREGKSAVRRNREKMKKVVIDLTISFTPGKASG